MLTKFMQDGNDVLCYGCGEDQVTCSNCQKEFTLRQKVYCGVVDVHFCVKCWPKLTDKQKEVYD